MIIVVKRAFELLRIVLINLLTIVLNLFIWRKESIWLFGSWMGMKFADNSRYLFQYLNEKKEEYGIKKVIWVTREITVLQELRSMGYECYMMHSLFSYYYHIKAGVHVICNMYARSGKYSGDILGVLSTGAKKLQLWHGVGIKACGGLVHKSLQKSESHNSLLRKLVSSALFLPGGWKQNAYFLATSEENKRVAIYDHLYSEKNIIIGIYPRLCETLRFTTAEMEVVEQIKELKLRQMKIILNLPTFREKDSYVEPLRIAGFRDFLVKNNIIWIEKKHSADANRTDINSDENIIGLQSWFDINVLWKYIDLLVSDYSSATSDAIYNNIITLDYCPDYKDYIEHDRGFVAPYEMYHIVNMPVLNWGCLEAEILKRLSNSNLYQSENERVRRFLFGDLQPDYDILVKTIINKMGILE